MCNIAFVTFLWLQYWSAWLIKICEHRKTCIFCVLSLVKPTKMSWNSLKKFGPEISLLAPGRPVLDCADVPAAVWIVCLSQVEKELKEICRDVLDILDKHLIPAASTGESKVFYYKMYVKSQYTLCSKVQICDIGKMIITAAKRIFNSDKICRSYNSDLNFGVTFLEHSSTVSN